MRYLPVVLMIIVFLGGNYYVFNRLWQMMPPTAIGRGALMAIFLFVFLSFFLVMLAGNYLPLHIASMMYKIGTSWFFFFLYLLMIFLTFDLIRITHLLPISKLMYNNWIGFILIAVLLTGIFGYGYFNYLNKRRVEMSLSFNKEKESTKPLKVVAVSDLHLGYGIGKEEFEQWILLINNEDPDVVLIAGDLIDNSLKPLLEDDFAPLFRTIQSTYGVYAAVGNHEYISGAAESKQFLSQAGVHVLTDSAALIDDRLYIVGRDDQSNPARRSISELTASLDRSKPVILLDHQPHHLEEAEKNQIDLQISGHTHRGQLWPITWITDGLFEVSHGYKKKGHTHIYVSSGLGIWGGKYRIGSQSEYVVFNLTL
ncbi:metallophosphoesterase [Parabacteroides sp. PF5-9]|uniref:metallophosphoesterase n=1 Tax=Parabacteroides sp. PF5-9 TaxID=1742404 RepID=UPI002475BDF0|nr:metallophosphoesterase [Parabacteroides sp. PF5-9]MDH6357525.1 putative MPP superfamily phosphohydrolase [Parabacteroides sp. PF5-9]